MLYHYCKLRLDFAEDESKCSGSESSFLATAHNDMGQAFSMNHLPEKAMPHLGRSRDIRSKLSGFQKDWLFSPLYHLALAKTCLGKHEEAFSIIQQAINDRIEVLGPDDRDSVRYVVLPKAIGVSLTSLELAHYTTLPETSRIVGACLTMRSAGIPKP